MQNPIEQLLAQEKIIIIDGSMSTALEALGCDLNDSLWTAKALAIHPELIKQVHLEYFRAGADCGITASYQATIPGLLKKGYTLTEAETLIQRSVQLFKEARQQWWEEEGQAAGRSFPLCLAGIGPYGAYLADGSEYRGHYGVSTAVLKEFHARRMELLYQAGADILLIETQPSLEEALIEAEIAEKLGAPYWISFSCKDGQHLCEGTSIAEAARCLSVNHPHLCAIGVNCTAPKYISELLAELRPNTKLPLAVYPNSGEHYDPTTKTWQGVPGERSFESYLPEWLELGAQLVGGCCCTVAKHIEAVVRARQAFLK